MTSTGLKGIKIIADDSLVGKMPGYIVCHGPAGDKNHHCTLVAFERDKITHFNFQGQPLDDYYYFFNMPEEMRDDLEATFVHHRYTFRNYLTSQVVLAPFTREEQLKELMQLLA